MVQKDEFISELFDIPFSSQFSYEQNILKTVPVVQSGTKSVQKRKSVPEWSKLDLISGSNRVLKRVFLYF